MRQFSIDYHYHLSDNGSQIKVIKKGKKNEKNVKSSWFSFYRIIIHIANS